MWAVGMEFYEVRCDMFGIIWAMIPSTVKWIGLSVLIGALGFGAWKWEHAGKLKAQAKLATAEQGYKILNDGYLKLYQEREKITAKAATQRRILRELEKANDLDGLRDDFNAPGGVRRPLHSNSQGSTQAPAAYYDPTAPGTQYQEAP